MKYEAVMKKLEKEYPDLMIAYRHHPRSRWNYSTPTKRDNELQYNHRRILPNEVVIDLDGKTKEENFEALRKLNIRLAKLGMKYSVWETGGAGFHIHLLFKRLETVNELKLMKEILLEWLSWRTDAKVDKQLCANHMVRFEYGKYEKNFEGNFKKPMMAKDHFKMNDIPKHIWNAYTSDILKWAVIRLHPKKMKVVSSMPLCLKHIMSQDFKEHKDGTKRALFVIASYHRAMDDEALFELLSDYNNYFTSEPLNDYQLRSLMRSVRLHKGRPVGCNFRHSLLREIGAGKIADECDKRKKVKVNNDDKSNSRQ